MYDLEVIVPAELNVPKIIKRIVDFRKWGLLNHSEFKIKLWFMVSHDNSPEDVKNLAKGWPENFDVEAVHTPYNHVAQRIYYYYANIIQPNTARWYMRIDEDSITDVKGLITKLDLYYDHKRDYHFGTNLDDTVEEIDKIIIDSIGHGWLYSEHKSPMHEHEASVTSLATMNRVLENIDSMKYLKLRQELASGHGDHSFAVAVQMNKVVPADCGFISHEPHIKEFSLYGGKLNHIHWIARDQNPHVLAWLEIEEVETPTVNPIQVAIEGGSRLAVFCQNGSVVDQYLRPIGLWKNTPTGVSVLLETEILQLRWEGDKLVSPDKKFLRIV